MDKEQLPFPETRSQAMTDRKWDAVGVLCVLVGVLVSMAFWPETKPKHIETDKLSCVAIQAPTTEYKYLCKVKP